MSDCTVPHISYGIKGLRTVRLNHGESMVKAGRIMRVLCVILVFTAAGSFPAGGQDTPSGQLERIEVEPPAQRAAPRTPRYDQGTRYEQSMPWEPELSDFQSPAGESGAGSESAMPSLSVVTDKSAISMSSESLPSQVNVVTRQEIERLDVRDYTDLFRKIPGIRSNAAGQREIGHRLQIRGNSGAHGRDTGVFVDGVPQNFPCTLVGGHGTTELSWLTPEMIERIEVIKGPFSALYGNFAQAGVINIVTKRSDPSPNLAASGASFGGVRGAAVLSSDSMNPIPFLANVYQTLDGYSENSQYKWFSTFDKGSVRFWDGYVSLRFNYYRSDWGAPGFWPIEDVRRGLVDRRSAVNPADGGNQRRWAFVLNYSPADMGAGLYLTAYVERYKRNRYATWLPSPQNIYDESATFCGGRVFYNFVFGNFASIAVGGESRYDTGDFQSFSGVNRQVTSVLKKYSLGLVNRAWFVQAEVKPSDYLKFVGGVRGDYFDYDIVNHVNPTNSGRAYPSIVSPKLGLVITPVKNINIFGNMGLGFRSPSADEMSPKSGQKNFELKPAKTNSWDMGFNLTLFDNIYLAFDYYRTDMEKEVRTVGDRPLNIGDSQRNGYEVDARFYASKQINLFASYAWVDAKVKNPSTAGQDKVTGVSEDAIKARIECTFDLGGGVKLLGDIYYEYFSGAPNYFGSDPKPVYGPVWDVYNFRMAWQGKNWGLFAAAKFQPREYSSTSVWASGTDLFFAPLPVWDVNAGLKYTF